MSYKVKPGPFNGLAMYGIDWIVCTHDTEEFVAGFGKQKHAERFAAMLNQESMTVEDKIKEELAMPTDD